MSDWDSFKDVCLPVRGSPTKNGAIVTGEVMKLYRGCWLVVSELFFYSLFGKMFVFSFSR